MSNELDAAEIGRLIGATAMADAAREASDRLAAYRDVLVRQARNAGMPAIKIAELTGLSRPRVYQIVSAPPPDADWWEHVEFAEEMDDLWRLAHHEWERHGMAGDVADYFHLGEAVDATR